MAKNRGQLVEDVEARVRRTGYTTEIQGALNDVLVERVARVHSFKDMIYVPDPVSVVEADLPTRAYALLPSSYKEILHVQLWNGTTPATVHLCQSRAVAEKGLLRGLHEAAYYAYEVNEDVDGDSSNERALRFVPEPSDAWDMHCVVAQLPDEMTDNSDVPGITGIDSVLVKGTCAEIFAALERWESAEEWEKRFAVALATAIREDDWDLATYIPVGVRPRFRGMSGRHDPDRLTDTHLEDTTSY